MTRPRAFRQATPTNGATGVAATTNVTINFNESVNVTGSTFTLECPVGSGVAFTNTTGTGPASTFVLDPTANIPAGVICTVTVVANQVSDADSADPPNNMVADYVFTFTVPPVANDDAYNATGNIAIVVPANGVLGNDVGPSRVVDRVGAATANTVVPGGGSVTVATAVAGGSVTMNSDGGFTYDPPPGQSSGTDTFKYRISNAAGNSADATVTITITDIVWFICDACGSSNAGTLLNPYTSVNAFSTNNTGAANKPAAGNKVYIRSGTYDAANDNLTLLNTQNVSGQGQAATSFFNPPTANTHGNYALLTAGTRPIIAPTAGNAVTLGTTNALSHSEYRQRARARRPVRC